jgi:hypothetical protein
MSLRINFTTIQVSRVSHNLNGYGETFGTEYSVIEFLQRIIYQFIYPYFTAPVVGNTCQSMRDGSRWEQSVDEYKKGYSPILVLDHKIAHSV